MASKKNPRKIGVRCYDAGDQVGDRYTVVYTGHYRHLTARQQLHVGMSARPFHPQGIGMHGESPKDIDRPSYGHLGKKISFDDLPPDCKKLVQQDIKELQQ